MENQGSFQNLPPCSCRNGKALKYRHYYSEDQLLGVCCTQCGQEWLQERFLFKENSHPLTINDVVFKKRRKIPIESNPAFQASDCRTMSSKNFKFEGDDLKVGDHLAWDRPLGYWHHAIVTKVCNEAGKVWVIEWKKTVCKLKRTESVVDLNEDKGPLFRTDYPGEVTDINPSELVIARARSMLDDPGKYSLFTDNCETLASYCKTGVAKSFQLDWMQRQRTNISSNIVVTTGRCIGMAIAVGIKESIQSWRKSSLGEGMAKISPTACQTAFRVIFGIGVGVVFLIEGIGCGLDIRNFGIGRANGNISRVDFIQSTVGRVVDAQVSFILCISISYLGGEQGRVIGTRICPGFRTALGLMIGGFIGGVLGAFVGKFIGCVAGPMCGRKFASIVGADDRAVKSINDVQPGDQLVFYGSLLHPRHHAIVVDRNPNTGKVRVVHHTYQNGVVEEELDFKTPVYRLLMYGTDCHSPDEVTERARSKIGDETKRYSLASYNCKTFARWCKVKRGYTVKKWLYLDSIFL